MRVMAVGVWVGRWRPCDIKRPAAEAIVCDGTMISRYQDDEDGGPGAHGLAILFL